MKASALNIYSCDQVPHRTCREMPQLKEYCNICSQNKTMPPHGALHIARQTHPARKKCFLDARFFLLNFALLSAGIYGALAHHCELSLRCTVLKKI